jgi:hypothetical protein
MHRADWWETEPKAIEVTIKVFEETCEGGKVIIEGSCQCPATLPVFNGEKCVAGGATITCDGGQMDADTCLCLDPKRPVFDGKNCIGDDTTAMVVDINDSKLDYRITMDVGNKVTLKEVLPSGATAFKWKMPDLSAPTSGEQTHTSCITVVNQSI